MRAEHKPGPQHLTSFGRLIHILGVEPIGTGHATEAPLDLGLQAKSIR